MDQHPAWGKAALSAAVAIATVAGTGAIHADQGANSAPQFDFYGSLRTQGEYVRPDNRDESEDGLDAYWGVRDAYSRLGVHMDWALNDWIDLFGQVELPIDTANGKVQDPWDQDADVRVAQIGLRGDFGRVAYGQQWMPYYNAIASPAGHVQYVLQRLCDVHILSAGRYRVVLHSRIGRVYVCRFLQPQPGRIASGRNAR